MSRPLATALLALLALALLIPVLAPVVPRLHEHFLGLEHVDAYGTQWFYWFVGHQLARGQGFGHTDLFFFPWGKDVFLHTGSNVLDALAALPLRALLGPVLGYNAFVLLGLAASGWAFYWLAGEFTRDRFVRGSAALLFALHPYLLTELTDGRPTQAIMVFPLLFLRSAWRTGLRPGWRDAALAGLWLALAGYQYWYYALFGGLLALGLGLWRALRPPPESGGRRQVLGRFALMAAVSVGLCLPVAGPLFWLSSQSGEVPGLLDTARWSLLASPPVTEDGQQVGLFLWQPLRMSTGLLVTRGQEEFFLQGDRRTPLILLACLVLALYRPGRLHRGPLLVMLGVATLLAMGPLVMLGEHALPNAAYIGLVKLGGPLRRLWWPSRAYAYIAVLSLLAVVAALDQLRRWRSWLAPLGALLCAASWVWTLQQAGLLPLPSWSARVPAGYRCLASGAPGAVIELPYAWTQAHLYYQSVHGHPILGGMIEDNPSFTPDEAEALRQENSWLARLVATSTAGRPVTSWTEADKAAMGELGYAYLVLQKDAFLERALSSALEAVARAELRGLRKEVMALAGDAVYEDARLAIFAPWGAPAPCEPGQVQGDQRPAGIPNMGGPTWNDPGDGSFERVFE